MELIVEQNHGEMCIRAVEEVLSVLRKKPGASFSMPTGETAKLFYKLLVRESKKKKLSFRKAKFFQLDETLDSKGESYADYLRKSFLNRVDFQEKNIHLFERDSKNLEVHAKEYEKSISKEGVDLMVLGLGTTGHIAFNEPGSASSSKTRLAVLAPNSPRIKKSKKVLTIGLFTIMRSKKIIVIASGKKKAKAVWGAYKKSYKKFPVALLRRHKNAKIIADVEAASLVPHNPVFREYDIRGIVPEQINGEFARELGRALVKSMKAKKVVVGRDARDSGRFLQKTLAKGITESGANVLSIGIATSPLTYFACRRFGCPGVMITASHNPKQYNGFKVVNKNGLAMGMRTDLGKIKKALGSDFKKARTGSIKKAVVFDDYKKHILDLVDEIKPLKVVVGSGNSRAYSLMKRILGKTPASFIEVPSKKGEIANPYTSPNLNVRKKIVKAKADIGIAFDFDGDRVFFFDEKGKRADNNAVISMIAKKLAKRGGTFLYDVRSDWVVKETIQKGGGKAVMARAGHSNIKRKMKELNAIYCGELSGHHYFKKNFFSESPIIAVATVLSILSKEKQPFSKIVSRFTKNKVMLEKNFSVEKRKEKIIEVARKLKGGKRSRIDGVRVDYKNWWFNLRVSNTEPVLRLNMGARNNKILREKKRVLSKLINS